MTARITQPPYTQQSPWTRSSSSHRRLPSKRDSSTPTRSSQSVRVGSQRPAKLTATHEHSHFSSVSATWVVNVPHIASSTTRIASQHSPRLQWPQPQLVVPLSATHVTFGEHAHNHTPCSAHIPLWHEDTAYPRFTLPNCSDRAAPKAWTRASVDASAAFVRRCPEPAGSQSTLSPRNAAPPDPPSSPSCPRCSRGVHMRQQQR